LQIKFIADENIDRYLIEYLRSKNFNIFSIYEENPGISDFDILELATKSNSVIITEDKDFGEWIFAHKKKSLGVIFLRYNYKDVEIIAHSIEKVLLNLKNSIFNKFVVITIKKVRVRDIL